MDINTRLHDLGIILPAPPQALGSYRSWIITGNLIYVSGQLSKYKDTLMTGKIGEGISREQGRTAAQYCAINVIAQLKEACQSNLNHVRRAVSLTGYINAVASFREHSHIMDGASDILYAVWGNDGQHTRSAVGCQSLPMEATMEMDAIFQISTE